MSISEVKQSIDRCLKQYYQSRIDDASKIHSRYQYLWENIGVQLAAGGKRFRPYMLIMAYQTYATDPDPQPILPAAIAIELVHQAMLIHDDIIDRDTIRHGIQNISGSYRREYALFISEAGEREHSADSSALLAGDLLLSDAYRLLSQVKSDPQSVLTVTNILSDAVFSTVGGELLDIEQTFISDNSIAAQTIARHKTASYSFVAPLTIGAVLAGASSGELGLLRRYAARLGIGYQMRDDLLGVFGDESQTGKSVLSDIAEGKRTYLLEQFDKCASPSQKAEFYQLFHTLDSSVESTVRSKQLLEVSGARTSVEAEIDSLRSQAITLARQLRLDCDRQQVFYQLVDICLNRYS